MRALRPRLAWSLARLPTRSFLFLSVRTTAHPDPGRRGVLAALRLVVVVGPGYGLVKLPGPSEGQVTREGSFPREGAGR